MLPEDPTLLAGVIIIFLLALSWHEAAHAWVADRLGDPTARQLGRVTLNPLKHIDPFLTLLMPALMYYFAGFIMGGGKPVPVNVMNFRHKARDFMFVALAGPFSNLVLAGGFVAAFLGGVWTGLLPSIVVDDPYVAEGFREIRPAFHPWTSAGSKAEILIKVGVLLNLALALFNLLPVPPLDGSRVIGWLLPRPLQFRWYALDRMGLLILILAVFAFGGIDHVMTGLLATFDVVSMTIDRVADLVPMT